MRKQFSFANTADAIGYAHGICDKITGGTSYAQVIGDVKNDVRPNDEYSANYLISNAVNIYCPAQLWQLRNSAGTYVPPPQWRLTAAQVNQELRAAAFPGSGAYEGGR